MSVDILSDFRQLELGFTGTRQGMTANQVLTIVQMLESLQPDKVHHGMCVGSDTLFHGLVRHSCPKAVIIGHPANNVHFSLISDLDVEFKREPIEALTRNLNIVGESSHIIATPLTFKKVVRSGTWATIRYARKAGKKISIVFSDGSISVEGQ